MNLVQEIITVGEVVCWRNPAGIPFGEKDAHRICVPWKAPGDLAVAAADALERAHRIDAEEPPAWDPAFGYVSPLPEHCGCAMSACATFHLEGLHLVGDLPPTLAALEAMRFRLFSINEDGVRDAGHLQTLDVNATLGITETDFARRAARVFSDLLTQEVNARKHLVRADGRIFEDAIARAIAILRSARLLSPWEYLDLLSPLRLAAGFGFLDGVTHGEIVRAMNRILDRPAEPLPNSDEENRARDARDAALANRANRRFERVQLNRRAKDALS